MVFSNLFATQTAKPLQQIAKLDLHLAKIVKIYALFQTSIKESAEAFMPKRKNLTHFFFMTTPFSGLESDTKSLPFFGPVAVHKIQTKMV